LARAIDVETDAPAEHTVTRMALLEDHVGSAGGVLADVNDRQRFAINLSEKVTVLVQEHTACPLRVVTGLAQPASQVQDYTQVVVRPEAQHRVPLGKPFQTLKSCGHQPPLLRRARSGSQVCVARELPQIIGSREGRRKRFVLKVRGVLLSTPLTISRTRLRSTASLVTTCTGSERLLLTVSAIDGFHASCRAGCGAGRRRGCDHAARTGRPQQVPWAVGSSFSGRVLHCCR
jgi:hypothetical protein